jgi:hypothetical protein
LANFTLASKSWKAKLEPIKFPERSPAKTTQRSHSEVIYD